MYSIITIVFAVGSDFFSQENIKSVVVAVLLSSKLSSYKGDLPKDAVIVSHFNLLSIFC
jgi:hypothetical protein